MLVDPVRKQECRRLKKVLAKEEYQGLGLDIEGYLRLAYIPLPTQMGLLRQFPEAR